MPSRLFIRNYRAGELLESFLISAIVGLLLIRLLLYITGYPQLGGQSLHIAHMLYGGVLMAAAVVITLTYLGYRARRLAAIVGGIGFGIFIDELGKFITRDNNYFFRPTATIIYILFVGLFFGFRLLGKRSNLNSKEYLMNALELIEEAVLEDMDEREKQRVVFYLQNAPKDDQLATKLRELLESAPVAADAKPGRLSRAKNYIETNYQRLAASPRFAGWIVWIFIGQAVISVALIVLALAAPTLHIEISGLGNGGVTSATISELSLSILSAALILYGAAQISRSRRRALEWFRAAILIDIVLKQPFAFYREQFSAVFGLSLYVLAIITLDYILKRESTENINRSGRDKSDRN